MKITPELLQKYYAGKCSNLEKKEIENWQNSSEMDLSFPSDKKMEIIEETIWENLSNTIPEINKPKSNLSLKKQKATYKRVKTIVAAASIVLIIGFASFQIFKSKATTYTTLAGNKQTITLKDGSIVHLNASSILEVPSEFTETTRTVTLIGEAYFEVVKDSIHPFIIETKNSITTVLGTKFNLSAFPNQKTILTLNEGKVSFMDKSKLVENELILLPNQQGVLVRDTLKMNTVNAKFYNSWLESNLFFNDDLQSVFNVIQRTYDVKITSNNQELLSRNYRGYHEKSSLEDVLRELSFVMKFNYEINGNTIIIN